MFFPTLEISIREKQNIRYYINEQERVLNFPSTNRRYGVLFQSFSDLEFDVSDNVFSNMRLPDYCTSGIENFSRCGFKHCTINFVQK